MCGEYKGPERREFLRCGHKRSMKYSTINIIKDKDFASELINAMSKNLSASGILFITNATKVPDISSLLVLDLDYKTANICREIEERILILENKLIGRVVRIEDNEDGTCGIGVAFVTKTDPLSKDIQNIEDLIKRC